MFKKNYAARLTLENIDEVITYGLKCGQDLEPFREDLSRNLAVGVETYILLSSCNVDRSWIISFESKTAPEFFYSWKFLDGKVRHAGDTIFQEVAPH